MLIEVGWHNFITISPLVQFCHDTVLIWTRDALNLEIRASVLFRDRPKSFNIIIIGPRTQEKICDSFNISFRTNKGF